MAGYNSEFSFRDIDKEKNKLLKEHKDLYEGIVEDVDDFFVNIKKYNLDERDGQADFSLTVAEALRDKEVLLIEAGVGVGKTKGYIIPILFAKKEDKNFNGVIISTSSIALQEQIKDEIEKVSKILNIDVPKITVIKGKNNYACISKINNKLSSSQNDSQIKFLNDVIKKINDGYYDRKDFPELSEREWNSVKINNCYFESCLHCNECPYFKLRKEALDSDISVCNHDLSIEHLKRNGENPILRNPSVLIFDEAHALEDKIRNSYTMSFDKLKIEKVICNLLNYIYPENSPRRVIEDKFFYCTKNLFINTKNNSIDGLVKVIGGNKDLTDYTRVSIVWDKNFEYNVKYILNKMRNVLNEVEQYRKINFIPEDSKLKRDKNLLQNRATLKSLIEVFEEILLKDKSIYAMWLEFEDEEHIRFNYSLKDVSSISSKILNGGEYSTIFTSGTMSDNMEYSYFKKNLGIDKMNQKVYTADPILSPYNYNENSLIYLPYDVANYKDRERYIEETAKKIEVLTNITEGRTLVLFTSKSDQIDIYNYLMSAGNIKYDILFQSDSMRLDNLRDEFSENEHSILLSTGAWEGFDVKGSSLSSLIIPRLPFPLQDPIIGAKASFYKNPMKEVYFKEMGIKLRQGLGRLIRSESDTGIVSILDDRTYKYYDDLIGLLMTNNITNDIEDVKNFSKAKILKK